MEIKLVNVWKYSNKLSNDFVGTFNKWWHVLQAEEWWRLDDSECGVISLFNVTNEDLFFNSFAVTALCIIIHDKAH